MSGERLQVAVETGRKGKWNNLKTSGIDRDLLNIEMYVSILASQGL